MKPVLTFDLNGTLIDTSSLDPFFHSAFGSADLRREWFTQLIELAMTSAATGEFLPFAMFADAALRMLAERHRLQISDQQAAELMTGVGNMPVFPDVSSGLDMLQDAGYRTVVLTNSARATAAATLQRAGVLDRFERILSVETTQCYKPAPQVYHAAAKELGVAPCDMMMVAAHNWDTTGAIRAGCRAAFLARPGEVLSVTDPRPEIIASDVMDLAGRLATPSAPFKDAQQP